jgi:hypothetical protein
MPSIIFNPVVWRNSACLRTRTAKDAPRRPLFRSAATSRSVIANCEADCSAALVKADAKDTVVQAKRFVHELDSDGSSQIIVQNLLYTALDSVMLTLARFRSAIFFEN